MWSNNINHSRFLVITSGTILMSIKMTIMANSLGLLTIIITTEKGYFVRNFLKIQVGKCNYYRLIKNRACT